MISHALTIVVNEMINHLVNAYGQSASPPPVALGNIAEGVASGAANNGTVAREILALSMINVREEKSLKNISNQVRNDVTFRVSYENPPVFLNAQILVVATHANYMNALLMLSRAVRFFQFTHVFTQDSVAPASITTNAPTNLLDQLETFKLIFDLYSPSMEEVNYLWGTLGGKQFPFLLYTLRLLELKFKATLSESGLITEVYSGFQHKNAAGT